MYELVYKSRVNFWADFLVIKGGLRVRFFGKIQIRILVSKNGFCVSLPKSENGLITD